MAMADASWWGDEAEFDADIQARLRSTDFLDRAEARKLLLARNSRRAQGRNPFASLPRPAPEAPEPPEAPQQAPSSPFVMQVYPGNGPAQPDATDILGPAAQGRHLRGMIRDVTGAIQDENDSRVSQARELRRMDHEARMESMRQEALLQRLAMAQQGRFAAGNTKRKLVNGRWRYV